VQTEEFKAQEPSRAKTGNARLLPASFRVFPRQPLSPRTRRGQRPLYLSTHAFSADSKKTTDTACVPIDRLRASVGQQKVDNLREAMEGEAADGVADQFDLEAAEQLIQLSGADDGMSSEGRSADSVKFCGPDQASMKEEEKDEMAVESRRRRSDGRSPSGKDGDGGESASNGMPDRKNAEGVDRSSRVPAGTEEKGDKEEEPVVDSRRRGAASARLLSVKDGAGVVDDGEERKRPRFRWLSDIYRETRQRQLTTRDWEHRAAGGNVPPVADERKKRKRATTPTRRWWSSPR
jgi:hypothetical protein